MDASGGLAAPPQKRACCGPPHLRICLGSRSHVSSQYLLFISNHIPFSCCFRASLVSCFSFPIYYPPACYPSSTAPASSWIKTGFLLINSTSWKVSLLLLLGHSSPGHNWLKALAPSLFSLLSLPSFTMNHSHHLHIMRLWFSVFYKNISINWILDSTSVFWCWFIGQSSMQGNFRNLSSF